jgi:hypothetical protein
VWSERRPDAKETTMTTLSKAGRQVADLFLMKAPAAVRLAEAHCPEGILVFQVTDLRLCGEVRAAADEVEAALGWDICLR